MTLIGADIAELRALANLFDTRVEQISSSKATIEAKLRSTAWRGRDADEFRSRWVDLRRGLDEVANALRATSQILNRQANEQEQASGVGGTVSPGIGIRPPGSPFGIPGGSPFGPQPGSPFGTPFGSSNGNPPLVSGPWVNQGDESGGLPYLPIPNLEGPIEGVQGSLFTYDLIHKISNLGDVYVLFQLDAPSNAILTQLDAGNRIPSYVGYGVDTVDWLNQVNQHGLGSTESVATLVENSARTACDLMVPGVGGLVFDITYEGSQVGLEHLGFYDYYEDFGPVADLGRDVDSLMAERDILYDQGRVEEARALTPIIEERVQEMSQQSEGWTGLGNAFVSIGEGMWSGLKSIFS